ncbi:MULTISPECIES: AI-2E family transporter [unclassified Sphingobium]|uniref:AI-2E family transporter n=1 Tax=unclassified Sphingobium TaxID=2611147 RepID=UPI000D1659FB|nr:MULTISPECIES: AI-2E family transporter [unclassified Sphingobium]PSO10675.1 AI-2E family transporter [Sphingobium sp. AEW4]TWD02156.1 putative PurR-regulated permease PerM [Sphingobium sp. AEW010]TWD20675.1 putative PurR-regulated permease PerM [Sphingobium sp. AEW013]TWD23403.1 putative PurR-regulated permease PerM [Sphingobium sp. AEW001]
MSDTQHHVEAPGPSEVRSPLVAHELQRAGVWFAFAIVIGLIALLAQPILLVLGALVLATMMDGGARLLNRILPIARGWRLTIVLLGAVAFMVWTFYLTGSSLMDQAQAMRTIVEAQVARVGGWMQQMGVSTTPEDLKSLASQAMSSMGRVTAAVGTAVGAITSGVMMLVLAIFIAVDPKLYERGVAWMLPMDKRSHFYAIADKMGWTLRRLMAGRLIGMTVEGVGTWLLLWAGGVPMAGLLGILTGLFAFLPNIGSIISGVLIILVGFSGGTNTGLYAFGVYLAVQLVDGYLIVPMVAKKATDLAPALVLAAQILFGALFGIMGLFLADPIVAMIKVYLEERSKRLEEVRARQVKDRLAV